MISGLVPWPRGKNEIIVQLSNRWHSASFGPIVVEYRRLPQVERWEAKLQPGRPFVTISAQVTSPTVLTRAEVQVLPRDGSAEPPYPVQWERKPEGLWEVHAEVPIRQGTNEVTIRAWNEDGESSPGKSQRLVYQKPVEPKPVVIVETPAKSVGRPVAPSGSVSAPPAP